MMKQVVFDRGPFGQRTQFSNPLYIIEATEIVDVSKAFDEIEKARAAGYWVSGYASFELGYCFEKRLERFLLRKRKIPLMLFGVFEPGQISQVEEPELAPVDVTNPEPLQDFSAYERAFHTVHEYTCAGDIYQANLTFPMQLKTTATPAEFYQALCHKQPVEHGAFVDLGGPVILSRSPELFFRVNQSGLIETRPMKGTIRRGNSIAEDEALHNQLAYSPKDRAENLMITDLLRNDVARVTEVGSVKVPELFQIESYTTVHQMVSHVQGQLLPQIDLKMLFEALFPCGSVVGAPKVRAMEIIAEMEPSPRDVYCGAIGWIAPDNRMAFNVAIRTLIVEESCNVRLNVGGGIVYDSTAKSEYDEALLKARFAVL
ncbi:MAG: aminodeoxychorismate synthase, component I [Blastopirellula sp.]|nr:MAG: aminodeoxychorismate synthase, component I [Blastopirellula sp.]